MIGRSSITSGSFVDDDGSSVCGLGSTFLVCMLFIMLVMVAHQTDEDRSEEHEDEGLKEGDEEFQERDQHGSDAADDGNTGDDARRAAFMHEGRSEQEQGREQDVSADHVGEEADGQCHGLDEDTGKLDDEDHRDDDQQELGPLGQAAGEVVEPAQDAEFTETVNLDHHETHQRKGDRDVDVAGGGSADHCPVIVTHGELPDDVLNVGQWNEAQQVHHQDEEEHGHEEREVLPGVLLAHDGFEHDVSEIEGDDLDQLADATFGDVSVISIALGAGLDRLGRAGQEDQQQHHAQKHGHHLHRDGSDDPDVEKFLVKNMPERGVELTG